MCLIIVIRCGYCVSDFFLCFFFFFKQKTAYEMRISDWSSDVCSSDLKRMYDRLELGCAQYFVVEDALGKQWAIAWCRQCDGRHCGRFDQRARMFGGMLEFETLAAPRHSDGGLVVRRGDGSMDEIGRAHV